MPLNPKSLSAPQVAEAKKALRGRLSGLDRRSIGAAGAVSVELAQKPSLVGLAVDLLTDDEPVIRMRAADALEKLSRHKPELILGYAQELLGVVSLQDQQEVRWHLLQMLPRLSLTQEQRRDALVLARASLGHPSRIVQCEALSALFALSTSTAECASAVNAATLVLKRGSPSLKARARKLIGGR